MFRWSLLYYCCNLLSVKKFLLTCYCNTICSMDMLPIISYCCPTLSADLLFMLLLAIKCRQVVVYMLVLYYINCVVIYPLLHCMSRGILLFICYCYTTYSVNMWCYCYSVEIHSFRFFLSHTKMISWRNMLLTLAPVHSSGCRI